MQPPAQDQCEWLQDEVPVSIISSRDENHHLKGVTSWPWPERWGHSPAQDQPGHEARRIPHPPMPKTKILFLCTGNSCRSQMAEGWARALKSEVIDACSAGIEKHGLNPHAVKVMAEAGVDISRHSCKTPAELGPVEFDYVVTVCGHADEHCPVFPARTKVVHVGFEDPPRLTKHLPDGEEKLAVYRRVRDELRRFIETLPDGLKTSPQPGP
jgi:arsenate reductase (thioredoxin)